MQWDVSTHARSVFRYPPQTGRIWTRKIQYSTYGSRISKLNSGLGGYIEKSRTSRHAAHARARLSRRPGVPLPSHAGTHGVRLPRRTPPTRPTYPHARVPLPRVHVRTPRTQHTPDLPSRRFAPARQPPLRGGCVRASPFLCFRHLVTLRLPSRGSSFSPTP